MFQTVKTTSLLLDSALLGGSSEAELTPQGLINDVQWVSKHVGPSLQRLLHAPALREGSPQRDALSRMPELALVWYRLAYGEELLNIWLPRHASDWAAYSDFVSFVRYAATLSELSDTLSLRRLQHLLAMAALRLKLDPLIHQHPEYAVQLGLSINTPGYLVALEIAAACRLSVASVRNAISRREMPTGATQGVPIHAALDWMVQRRGFLYPMINAITPGRRINGRLANQWLKEEPRVVELRRVSRLRMMQWRVKGSQSCFGINEQGLHHCLITLPGGNPDELSQAGIEALEDRSSDSVITLLRQSFSAAAVAGKEAATAPIYQGVIPTVQALDSVIDYLTQPRESAVTLQQSTTPEAGHYRSNGSNEPTAC